MAKTTIKYTSKSSIPSIVIETKTESLIINYEKIMSIKFLEENGKFLVMAEYGGHQCSIELACKEELEACKKRIVESL